MAIAGGLTFNYGNRGSLLCALCMYKQAVIEEQTCALPLSASSLLSWLVVKAVGNAASSSALFFEEI